MLKSKSKFSRPSKLARGRSVKGSGVVNTLINKLPFELHIPGYNYCGAGTKLEKRLKRGDPGINKLDEACKQHDIAYNREKDIPGRHIADRILADKAVERLRSSDASFGEKAAALGVATAMKAKVKLGMGCVNRKKKSGGTLSFKAATKHAKNALKKAHNISNLKDAIKIAIGAIRKSKKGKKIGSTRSRIIPVPKTGGILPLIPLFAGLSAIGALAGGTSGVVKAINDAKSASEQLKEAQRHNKSMEAIAMGKGLYLKPYKKGLGLFLRPANYQNDFR